MKYQLILVVCISCAYLVSGNYVSRYYTNCRDNPCNPHEVCRENFGDSHSYSCCLRMHGTERYCTIHTKVKSLKEMIPLTLTLFFALIFTVIFWCVLQYIVKKSINCCIRIGMSNGTAKFFRRARVLFGRKTRRNSQNQIEAPIVAILPPTRPSEQPPVYELPPSYENATKHNSVVWCNEFKKNVFFWYPTQKWIFGCSLNAYFSFKYDEQGSKRQTILSGVSKNRLRYSNTIKFINIMT